MICKIILLGLAGLTLAGEPDVFQNYFDDTIKEVDIPLDAAIKACLQNGNTFADKVKKAYADCFGSADYDFGDLAAKEGSKDSDNDGLPDSFENNEQCFYKKMGWVNEAGALNPDAIKGDLAGMESGTKTEFDGNIDKCASWNGDFGSRRKREAGENEVSNVPSVMESGGSALGWLKSAVRKARNAEPGNGNKGKARNKKSKKGRRNTKKGRRNSKKRGRNAKKGKARNKKPKKGRRNAKKGRRNTKKGRRNTKKRGRNAKKGKARNKKSKKGRRNDKKGRRNSKKRGRNAKKGKARNKKSKKGRNKKSKKGNNGQRKNGQRNNKKPKKGKRNNKKSKKSKPEKPEKKNRNNNAMDESTYNKLWCFDLSLEQILEKCVENKIKN